MSHTVFTRMGDGERISIEVGELREQLRKGTEDASHKGSVPQLDAAEMEALCDIFCEPGRAVSVPLFYGAQPNLGLYFQPDGPFPNPADLLPAGKIAEARKAQEGAAQALRSDMVFVGQRLNEVGCEGLNFDTAGSSGDPDFYATLQAVRELKASCPTMPIIVGMAAEFVLGMHGEIFFDGQRLAGMFPHRQVKIVEAAGADIFGPAVNVNTSQTIPWNLSRAVTFVKETVKVAEVSVHPNVGMGVCGIPMMVQTPIDCVTRVSKALALIGKADGL